MRNSPFGSRLFSSFFLDRGRCCGVAGAGVSDTAEPLDHRFPPGVTEPTILVRLIVANGCRRGSASVAVENKPGAASTIAKTEAGVTRRRPNCYTLGSSHPPTRSTPAVTKRTPVSTNLKQSLACLPGMSQGPSVDWCQSVRAVYERRLVRPPIPPPIRASLNMGTPPSGPTGPSNLAG